MLIEMNRQIFLSRKTQRNKIYYILFGVFFMSAAYQVIRRSTAVYTHFFEEQVFVNRA